MRLRGDVLIAAVCGEIEKTQYGDARGAAVPRLRGRDALPRLARRRRRHVPARRADRGQGRARPLRRALAADPRPRQLHPHRLQRGPARRELDPAHARGARRGAREWIPTWEDDPSNSYRGAKAIVNVGAVEGGFGWRVSRTPHHTDLFLDVRVPPTKPMGVARREVLDMVRGLAARFPEYGVEGEVYVTAPGAEIEEGHELVARDRRRARGGLRRARRSRDVTRWFCDASALTRYGIPTVNYGTSTGLHGRRARREPRDRRARQDGRDVRARGPAGLRSRVTAERRRCPRGCRCRRTTAPPTTSSASSCPTSSSTRRRGPFGSATST